jgi:hypothetical protein
MATESNPALDDVLVDACRRLDVPERFFGNEIRADMIVDDIEMVIFRVGREDELLLLYAEVGALAEGDIETARALLLANHPEAMTPGVTLALVPETRLVALSQPIPIADLDGAGLAEALEAFARAAAQWRGSLTPGPDAPSRVDRDLEMPGIHWIPG